MFFKFRKTSSAKGKTIKKRETTPPLATTHTPSLGSNVLGESENSDKEQGDKVTLAEFFKQETADRQKQKQNEERKTLGGRIIPEPPHTTPTEKAISHTPETTTKETPTNSKSPAPNPTTCPDETTPQQPPNPALHLLLGPQDPHSPYLTRRYFLLPSTSPLSPIPHPSTSSPEQISPLHLPSLDPHAFSLYSIYTHTGSIPLHYPGFHYPPIHLPSQYTWQVHWPLINAHILGCVIEEPEFADRIMDILVEKIGIVRPDEETIGHLFEEKKEGVSEALRRFVVEKWVECGVAGVDVEKLPAGFVNMALGSAMGRLSGAGGGVHAEDCEYHIHDAPGDCYRRRVSPADVRRGRRLQLQREMSRKDSREAVSNADNNGVKSIDWEVRKTEAHRASKVQTVPTWAGFTRLNDGKYNMSPTFNPQYAEGNTREDPLTGPTPLLKALHIPSSQSQDQSQTPTPPTPTPPSPVELQGTPIHPDNPIPKDNTPTPNSNLHTIPTLNLAPTPPPKSTPQAQKPQQCPGAFPASRAGSTRSTDD